MEDKRNDISIKQIISNLKKFKDVNLKNFRTIFILCIVSGLIGFCAAFFSNAKYQSELSFTIDEGAQSNLSPYSQLASQFGLGGGSSINISKIKELFFSRRIVYTTLLHEFNLNGKNDLFVNHFLDSKELDSLKISSPETFKHNREENKVLDEIFSQIVKKELVVDFSHESNIIQTVFTNEREDLALAFNKEIFNVMLQYYTNQSTERNLHSYKILKERSDSVEKVLKQEEMNLALLQDNNIRINKSVGKIEELKSRREVTILNTILVEIKKNMELTHFSLVNTRPVFQIIDSPTLPLKIVKPSPFIFAVLSIFLCYLLAIGFIYLRQILTDVS